MFETIICGMILITIFVAIYASTLNVPDGKISFEDSETEEHVYDEEKEYANFRKIVRPLWLNGISYDDGYNPFSAFSPKEWRERLFYIESLITNLNYRYCKHNVYVEQSSVKYPDGLRIKCNLNISHLYDKYLSNKDFLSLNIETVTQLEWIEFEYINYLFNCYVYHEVPMDNIDDNYKYYLAHLKRNSLIHKRYDDKDYWSKYPINLFVKNMSEYPFIKKLRLEPHDLKGFYEKARMIITIRVDQIKCFSCFKDIYEWMMKCIEDDVLDTIRDEYELLKEKKRKERLAKKKELNKKKPKRNKLNHYNKKR